MPFSQNGNLNDIRSLKIFKVLNDSTLPAIEGDIAEACKDATVGKGLAMRGTTAQNSREQAKKSVLAWLERAGF